MPTASNDSMEATSAPFLSFCIPTYNRSTTVHALVSRVLSCTDSDIEVVVLDNGSTDDTLERLAGIADPRVTVCSNGSNRGVLFNVVNVLLHGRGEYCVLLLDKDSLDPECIGAFKTFLSESRVTCGLSEYANPDDLPPEIIPGGLPALLRIGYSCHHPTGYFFDAARLRALRIDERFVNYELAGHFPFEFVQAELAVQGPVAIYHPHAFIPEDLQGCNVKKSVGTNAAKEDAFFSPKGRLKMAVNFSRHILTLPLKNAEKRRLVLDCFYKGLVTATWSYRNTLLDERVCEHYHIATRRIGAIELAGLVLRYLCDYARATLTTPAFQELRLSRTDLVSEITARGMRALLKRATRRFV